MFLVIKVSCSTPQVKQSVLSTNYLLTKLKGLCGLWIIMFFSFKVINIIFVNANILI